MVSVNRGASWAIATKGGRVTSKTKVKTAYVCNECGADYNKWQGQCSECQTWNSVVEMRLGPTARNSSARFDGYAGSAGGNPVQTLADISLADLPRFGSGAGEFDPVLGGGFVHGTVVLIGGSASESKRTLLLRTLCKLAQNMSALYVTGEESLQQVAMRGKRLELPTERLKMNSEISVEAVCAAAKKVNPKVMVGVSI